MTRKYLPILFVLFAVLLAGCAGSGKVNIISPSKNLEFSMDTPQGYVLLDVQLENTFQHPVLVDLSIDGTYISTCDVPAASVLKCLPVPVSATGPHTVRATYGNDDAQAVTQAVEINWVLKQSGFSTFSDAVSKGMSTTAVFIAIAFFVVCLGLLIVSPRLGYVRHINLHKGTDTTMIGVGTRSSNVASTALNGGRAVAEKDFLESISDPKIIADAAAMYRLQDGKNQ